jgi:hypothetical protein
MLTDLKHVIDEGQALTKIASRFTIECHLRKNGWLSKKAKPGYAAQEYLRKTLWMQEVEALFRTAYPTCE